MPVKNRPRRSYGGRGYLPRRDRRLASPRSNTIPMPDRHGRDCRRRCREFVSGNVRCSKRRLKAMHLSARPQPDDETRHDAHTRQSSSASPSTASRSRPSTPLISIRCAGRAMRNAIIGTRLWPPARMRPSSGRRTRRVDPRPLRRSVERGKQMSRASPDHMSCQVRAHFLSMLGTMIPRSQRAARPPSRPLR